MNWLILFYIMFAAGYSLVRESDEVLKNKWYHFVLSLVAFPTTLGADVYEALQKKHNYQFVTNIHNHTNGDVTVTKL